MAARRVFVVLAIALAATVACTDQNAKVRDEPQVLLETLPVVQRPHRDPNYRRDLFGAAWADTDHNGCSQRQDVLWRDLIRTRPTDVRRRGTCTHEIYGGTWNDPYSGESLTFTNLKDPAQAQHLPIDHIVALSVAYRWSAEQRLEFANDLDNLQPTTDYTNRGKGDNDAASWRPPAAQQCTYARRYIMIKGKYRLPVDSIEKQALTVMLTTCQRSGLAESSPSAGHHL